MTARIRTLGVHGNLKIARFVVLGIVAAAQLAAAQSAANTETAESTFKTTCAICHAEDGSGTALGRRLHAKDLRSKEVQEKSSAALAQTIRAGKGNMPAFGDRLNSEQIQKLINYIRRNTHHREQTASNR
jgi:cytochrome c6